MVVVFLIHTHSVITSSGREGGRECTGREGGGRVGGRGGGRGGGREKIPA